MQLLLVLLGLLETSARYDGGVALVPMDAERRDYDCSDDQGCCSVEVGRGKRFATCGAVLGDVTHADLFACAHYFYESAGKRLRCRDNSDKGGQVCHDVGKGFLGSRLFGLKKECPRDTTAVVQQHGPDVHIMTTGLGFPGLAKRFSEHVLPSIIAQLPPHSTLLITDHDRQNVPSYEVPPGVGHAKKGFFDPADLALFGRKHTIVLLLDFAHVYHYLLTDEGAQLTFDARHDYSGASKKKRREGVKVPVPPNVGAIYFDLLDWDKATEHAFAGSEFRLFQYEQTQGGMGRPGYTVTTFIDKFGDLERADDFMRIFEPDYVTAGGTMFILKSQLNGKDLQEVERKGEAGKSFPATGCRAVQVTGAGAVAWNDFKGPSTRPAGMSFQFKQLGTWPLEESALQGDALGSYVWGDLRSKMEGLDTQLWH